MVLLGLLGDVHKGNFTWNLKAFDEFQSLLIFAGQILKPVFHPKCGVFTNLVKLQISRQIPINQNFTWNLKAFDEFQSLLISPVRFGAGFPSKVQSFHKSR